MNLSVHRLCASLGRSFLPAHEKGSQKEVTAMANKFNTEGYFDPTPHKALGNIEIQLAEAHAWRPTVYICSPFAGDVSGNIENARKYCRFAVKQGYLPIAPHLLFPQFLDDGNPVERELGIHFGNVLMGLCRELWVCGDTVSGGMGREIRRARKKDMIVRRFNGDLEEVKK